jgi:hypothetical protein
MDLSKAPKQFCDSINVGFTDEFFLMAVSSGQNTLVFALTPGHAKRLMQMLAHNITKYEEQFGELKTQWLNNIPSPIQISDLGNGPSKEEK